MTYKRATAQLRAAGIEHIIIKKRFWGASPYDPRMTTQRSQCFTTWQEAVQAVKDGFRPTDPMDPKELTLDLDTDVLKALAAKENLWI